MARKFRHLTNENRITILTLLRAGHSIDAIAKQLRFHRSTYREVARNGTKLGYLPLIAERKVEARPSVVLSLVIMKCLKNISLINSNSVSH